MNTKRIHGDHGPRIHQSTQQSLLDRLSQYFWFRPVPGQVNRPEETIRTQVEALETISGRKHGPDRPGYFFHNGQIVLVGTDKDDRIVGGRDPETGRLYFEINGRRVEIKPEDETQARGVIVLGGAGNDQIDLSGIKVDLPALIFGGAGDDTIKGTRTGDQIFGGSGNDNIHGAGGNDHVEGNDGNDELRGGSGDDHVFGGAGDDLVAGNKGDDFLSGGVGDDDLRGGEGQDIYDDYLQPMGTFRPPMLKHKV